MKVGFVVHFFDFRNDVRKVIELVSQQHEVVLLVRRADVEIIRKHVGGSVEIRVVDEEKKTLRNRAAMQMMRFFGVLPKSTQNYYLMEMFKIYGNPNPAVRPAAVRALEVAMHLPKFVAYDTFLAWLDYKAATRIDDIDQFICFTEISDNFLLARLLDEGKKLAVYVYSWDHPCKQVRFSKRVRYMVWNEGIKKDMTELQGIPPAQVTVTGASQFAYVDNYQQLPAHRKTPFFDFPYIYFGCSIGIPELAAKEIELIKQLGNWLQEIGSDLTLVVRPYPNFRHWEWYQALTALPNVVLDDRFRSADLAVSEDNIMEKFIKIEHARLFIHLGTTLGFEACFTDTPSIILDLKSFKTGKPLSIYNFVHQYQIEKYLLREGCPNIVRSESAFKALVKELDGKRAELLQYNHAVRRLITIKSFEAFARDIVG